MTNRWASHIVLWVSLLVVAATAASVAAAGGADSRDSKDDALLAETAPRVAVTEFVDRSRARVDNLGPGLAAKLADRLVDGGVRVVGLGEIDSFLLEGGLDPASVVDLSFAARQLGADLVVRGVIERLSVNSASLGILFLTLTSSETRVETSAELIDPSIGDVSAAVRAEGVGRDPGRLSIDFGSLAPLDPTGDVCSGGLRVERDVVADGSLVSVGYRNDGDSDWYGLEVTAVDGTFLRWLGWRFIDGGACETWLWNLRDALGLPVPSGVYVIGIRRAEGPVASVTVQVRPTVSLVLPSLDVVTVGTQEFDAGGIGLAVDDAIAKLAAALLPGIFAHGVSRSAAASEGTAAALLAQVAAVLPDGTLTVNVGGFHGVAVGDRFEILAVDDLVFHPETLEIASYHVTDSKGWAEVVEVRDRASTAVRLGEFEPSVGDLARRVP